MLEQFTVENFKGFEKLTLEDLGHINIFVGKNNTGKTSLLQAVSLYSISVWVKNTVNPSGSKNLEFPFFTGVSQKTIIKDLKTVKPTILTGVDETFSVKLVNKFEHPSESEVIQIVDATKQESIFNFSHYDGEESTFFNNLYHFLLFLTANAEYNELATEYYYDAVQKKLDKLILDTLRTNIAPTLVEIKYDNKGGLAVDLSDKPVLLPLASMGDGFIKLLGLTTVLLARTAETVLIDEPENGFHYSVQSQFWQLLATAGLEHGKQSFIATHSYELLESLNTLLNENPDLTKSLEEGGQGLKVRIYRLKRTADSGEIKVSKIKEGTLARLLARKEEIR
jgi:AAA15 family ATPase/GTPase